MSGQLHPSCQVRIGLPLSKFDRYCYFLLVQPSNRIGGKHTLTMIPGDGVGPELCESVKMVFTAAGVPVEWNEIAVRLVLLSN